MITYIDARKRVYTYFMLEKISRKSIIEIVKTLYLIMDLLVIIFQIVSYKVYTFK